MTRQSTTIASLVVAALFAFTGCGSDSPVAVRQSTLVLSFQMLAPLAGGFHYEGWAIVGGAPISTGKFNVDGTGNLVGLDGAAIPGGAFETTTDLGEATAIVVTIEPPGDMDAVPAATHVLGGSVTALEAILAVGAPQALGDDFGAATGSFILATPTDAAMDDENSGIWFLSLASGAPAPGLSLPTLPGGWAYEGWAVIDGMPVSTGTFLSTMGADDASTFSGPMAGPPFPGEDFLFNAPAGITFPTDLAGMTGVISIEPSPDDSPLPFALKPLVGMIPPTATTGMTFDLGNNAGMFPMGSATIR